MAIAVTCTHCGVKLRFKAEHAGKTTKCRACEQPIVVQGQTIPDHDIFLSYSSKDKNVADAACAALEARKIRCWVAPRDVLPGKPWAGAILDAISDARIMVLVYSSSANASPQVIREVDRAVTRNVIIVPFRIDDAAMSKEMEYYIGAAHWLDAMTGPMEEHIAKLVGVVKRLLSDQPAVESKAPVQPTVTAGRKPIAALLACAILVLVLLSAIGLAWKGGYLHRRQSADDGNRQASLTPSVQETPAPKTEPADSAPSITATKTAASAADATDRASTTPTVATSPPPGSIDLLAKARFADDVVSGVWTKTDQGIHGERTRASQELNRLRFFYQPHGEYDFSITFTRTNGIAQVLAYGTTAFSWEIGARSNTGFALVRNERFLKNSTRATVTPALENGTRYTSLVKVRKNSVSAYIDGKLVSELKTDYSDLSLSAKESLGEGYLGISSNGSIDVLSAYVTPQDPPSGQPAQHLWVQSGVSSLQTFVNGKQLKGDQHGTLWDYRVALHSGDLIVCRIANAPSGVRGIRMAYLNGDDSIISVDLDDALVARQISGAAEPLPATIPRDRTQLFVGAWGKQETAAWTHQRLPEESKALAVADKDKDFDFVCRVRRSDPPATPDVSQAVANIGTLSGRHLWIIGGNVTSEITVYVNGKTAVGRVVSPGKEVWDYPIELKSGDVVVIRAMSLNNVRAIRFAYLVDTRTVLASSPSNTTVRIAGSANDPPPTDPSAGETARSTVYALPKESLWHIADLPEEAKPISLTERGAIYDVIFKMP